MMLDLGDEGQNMVASFAHLGNLEILIKLANS